VAAVKGMLELILQSTTKKNPDISEIYCINIVPEIFNLFLNNLSVTIFRRKFKDVYVSM